VIVVRKDFGRDETIGTQGTLGTIKALEYTSTYRQDTGVARSQKQWTALGRVFLRCRV